MSVDSHTTVLYRLDGFPPTPESCLLRALQKSNIPDALQVLSDPVLIFGKYLNINCTSPGTKFTPLHFAADLQNQELATAVLALSPVVTRKSDKGESAAHISAKRGDFEMLRLLVDWGGDAVLLDEDSNGNTPVTLLPTACLNDEQRKWLLKREQSAVVKRRRTSKK